MGSIPIDAAHLRIGLDPLGPFQLRICSLYVSLFLNKQLGQRWNIRKPNNFCLCLIHFINMIRACSPQGWQESTCHSPRPPSEQTATETWQEFFSVKPVTVGLHYFWKNGFLKTSSVLSNVPCYHPSCKLEVFYVMISNYIVKAYQNFSDFK